MLEWIVNTREFSFAQSKTIEMGASEIKLLLIHADKISYKTTQRTKVTEDIESTEDSMEDCLVVFASIEKLDELNAAGVTRRLTTASWMCLASLRKIA